MKQVQWKLHIEASVFTCEVSSRKTFRRLISEKNTLTRKTGKGEDCWNFAWLEENVLVPVSWEGLFVCWLLNVPATCECISGTDLHRQFYVLPH